LKSSLGAGVFTGLGDLSFLSQLSPVSAAEAALEPPVVQLRPEIEGTVRLLEDTPRDRLLEQVAGRIRRGLSYREVLAALMLAGVRNVEPRPSVGFKFHAVLVVNSAHLASLSSPDSDRWLPIFWALDYFKSSQARDVREGNWTMPPVDEAAVPAPQRAREELLGAMDRWDEEAADAAVAGLARTSGVNQLFEIFAHYGCRDFRSIGHKAIFVANGWRTLQCIGWQHAEPILRSLAYALLNHQGEPNPAQDDLSPDRPWRRNRTLAPKIRNGWQVGRADNEATAEMLATLRDGSDEDASLKVVQLLNRGVAPQSVYDALFLGAGELLMRQPGIVALHAVTSTNALHYAFQTVTSDETRRLLLLQNASFLPLFRQAMYGRGNVGELHIDRLEPAALESSRGDATVEVFRDVSQDRTRAASKALAYLNADGRPRDLINAARRLIFLKGTDSHDYKFSSAALEDYYHVSPAWRDRFLASAMYNLRGSEGQDNSLVQRTRAALGAS
jgi:hypothetical protein